MDSDRNSNPDPGPEANRDANQAMSDARASHGAEPAEGKDASQSASNQTTEMLTESSDTPVEESAEAGRGRRCPSCGVSLQGLGTLTACPACGVSFIEPVTTGKSHVAQGLRIIGPWVALGGMLAVWRLDKLGSNRVLESIDWFYFALVALGVGMWCVGKWMGINETK